MKTKLFFINSLYLSAGILLSSCVNGSKKADGNVEVQSDNLSYLYQDVPPEQAGGAWKRVWSLSGLYTGDVAVDELEDRDEGNWKEIARTNRAGVFIQKDTTQEKKYRFDGTLETPWMPILKDTVVSAAPNEVNIYEGHRCIVPANVNVPIAHKKLVLKCTETVIEGNVYAYYATYKSRRAGKIEIISDTVTIKGNIHLIGEAGGENGQRIGPQGGKGGTIQIKARKKFNLDDESQLSVAGGQAGWGVGAAARPGVAGEDGLMQIEKPEQENIQ